MITPTKRPMGIQQLLQQIIEQNELLKQQMVDQQAMFQNELQGMREVIRIMELKTEPTEEPIIIEPVLEPNPEENGWTEA